MSYTALTYHIVFSTSRRHPLIYHAHERELYKFIYSFSTQRGVKIWRIGGMPDHVHILCDIPASLAVADFVKTVKAESSKFLKINQHFKGWEKWEEGYFASVVESARRNICIEYIKNQRNHHNYKSFEEEFLEFLKDNDIPYDKFISKK